MSSRSTARSNLPWAGILLSALFCLPQLAFADKDRVARQQELDRACEAARQKVLVPLRRDKVKECMATEDRDQEDCEAAYSNYGERAGSRPPLLYDLPECVAAADFQRSVRQAK